MTNKRCISCGMPMVKPEEFAANNPDKDFCVYCSKPDGTLKSYDETLAGMTGFIIRSQGLDEKAARQAAKDLMSTMPAWKNR